MRSDNKIHLVYEDGQFIACYLKDNHCWETIKGVYYQTEINGYAAQYDYLDWDQRMRRVSFFYAETMSALKKKLRRRIAKIAYNNNDVAS